MTRTLLLVRHATSVPPTPGGPDEYARPLAAQGTVEAERLAAELVAFAPLRVLSSPYLRAVQTVRPAADRVGLPVEPRAELREWRSGVAPTPDWQPYYRHCWDHPAHAAAGGETHAALSARAVAEIERVRGETPDGGVVVLGSHGGWIARALHGLGERVDCNFWFAMPMPAVYAVTYDGDVRTVSGPGL